MNIIRAINFTHGKTNCQYGGQISQLTACELDGVRFYVREAINNIDSFQISSAERWGDKVGMSKVRKERQCLELFAPEEHWQRLADLIHKTDILHRPVRKNRLFTMAWVNNILNTQS